MSTTNVQTAIGMDADGTTDLEDAPVAAQLEAWQLAGWDTVIHESTPDVRREVREWQHGADVRLGRRRRP